MRATPGVTRATPTSARRRRERRTRSFFRREQVTVKMAVLSALHRSAQRCCSIATQTDDFVATLATFFNMSDGDEDPAGFSAPVIEHVAPAPVMTDGTSLLEPVPLVLIEDVAPAPTVTCSRPMTVNPFVVPAPVIEYIIPPSAAACFRLERVQVPIPQIQEQMVENIKVTPGELFPGRVEEHACDARTRCHFDCAC